MSRYFEADGGTVVELFHNGIGRWYVRTSSFPAMETIKAERFGWDRAAAEQAFERRQAVEVAKRALGVKGA